MTNIFTWQPAKNAMSFAYLSAWSGPAWSAAGS
jgi:hypothetical protein